jgi:hypothetical protein
MTGSLQAHKTAKRPRILLYAHFTALGPQDCLGFTEGSGHQDWSGYQDRNGFQY